MEGPKLSWQPAIELPLMFRQACMCLCVSGPPYRSVSRRPYTLEQHFQKEALLPSKVEIAPFQRHCGLTRWQSSLLTSKGESIYDSLLLPILSCSRLPASYSVSSQIRSMQIRNAPIIRRPSADRSSGDHQISIQIC